MAEKGKYAGRELALAIYLKDGCIYLASHINDPPVTVVNGRRLRKSVWPQVYLRISHVPQAAYHEAAKIVDELNAEHGQCWTTVFRGSEGDASREFLDKIHSHEARKLMEDPDIAHAVVRV